MSATAARFARDADPLRNSVAGRPGAAPRAVQPPSRISTRKTASAKAVGSFVPKLARKAFERHGFSTVTLLTDWAGLVGADLGRSTAPERLIWPGATERGASDHGDRRHGATLVLAVDPARALEVEYRAAQIRERINIRFGYQAVAQVRVRQQPLFLPATTVPVDQRARRSPPLAPAPELAAISDLALRAALARLGASVMSESGRCEDLRRRG